MKKDKTISLEEGMKAFELLRQQAKENGIQDLTLEEINAEIEAARKEK